ncbi:MAG: transcription elongation factor GreA [Phycisphaerales bacterium]|nr:transcription elongation factor GreA [Phycisphaerales bacterium]
MDFITADEKLQLERTLAQLRSDELVLRQRITEARAMGDLRENSEYHAAREDKALNETKTKEVEARLASAQIANASELPQDIVFVGSMVKLRDIVSGEEDCYRLVGLSSGRFDLDYIEVTVTSPIGSALMGARIGETVRVDLPRGERRYLIVEISV